MRTLLLLLLSLSVQANADFEIRLGVHNFPPYFVMTDNDNCGGEAVELTRNILQQGNIRLTTVCAPPARLYKMLQNGEVDLTINIKHTQALPANISFIQTPFAQLSLILLSNSSAAAPDKPTIAAIRGFDYHGQREVMAAKGFSFIDLPDSISAVEMFVRDRSTALLTYQAPFDHYLQQHKLSFEKHYQYKVLEHIDAYYVISEQSPHKVYITETLNRYASSEQLSYFAH
ncbi:hypothetical protein WG68_13600 [Arsukibacterium ikkense]|uniref:Solute-binding protein family 3/N-terminal domain-containing protein n=1 Tax=Arsukibacterium ikkense TaxID=336831 RepID=A0A0M2V5E1_9GAMM|nr:transporter substrate-binding domain-containing protein [Arsukibacterium ikkense]KKO44860.1 hypothetical protein WG68_13600 [Arsukibacterium ikkense]